MVAGAEKVVVLVLSCSLAICSVTIAQTSGNIRGVIQDSDQQPVPGAAVTIHSAALIGSSRTTYSNELGVFRFPSVPIGTYTTEVALEGFETARIDHVEVRLDSSAYIPFTLKIAGVREEMTVVSEVPMIDPTNSGMSTSYKGKMLEELPTQRAMYDLM